MPTYKHGVYVREEATSLIAPIRGTSGLQVIFGTAPAALADDPTTCLEPKLCYTYEEAVKALGYSDDWAKYTLCQSMDACFRVFNIAPVVFVNVFDPLKTGNSTAVSAAEMDVTAHKILIKSTSEPDGVFGIIRSTISVKTAISGGTSLAEGTDYTITQDSAGRTTITLVSGSTNYSAAKLSVAYSTMKVDGITKTDIIGGYDASTGKRTGLDLIHEIYPRFALTPGVILAPGWSSDAQVVAALEAHCTGVSGVYQCEAIADIPSDSTSGVIVYSGVKDKKDSLGMDSAHLVACWPKAAIGNKIYCLSALLGALCAQTDAPLPCRWHRSRPHAGAGQRGKLLRRGHRPRARHPARMGQPHRLLSRADGPQGHVDRHAPDVYLAIQYPHPHVFPAGRRPHELPPYRIDYRFV